ncbi:uncharacterized protein LOC136085132 isoform X1 [Hydra vulgaris]|uniref:uncharacterized protein LOC136085132 isoform X1 n=1 Tax=Hydra vulgaris TaxID=6087 RepID=UPI0032EA63D0
MKIYQILMVLSTSTLLTILSMCLYQYDNLHYKNPELQKNNTNAIVKPCICQTIDCVMQGKWIPRFNISINEVMEVERIHKLYSPKKDFPYEENLRHDEHCGPFYDVNSFASQCKKNSSKPCCNEQLQKCGGNETYCNCDACTNYNISLKHASLHNWVEHFCPNENFNTKSTCDFLSNHFSSMLFVGDSLVRQFFGGLLMHLTDDKIHGTLISTLDQSIFSECKGELQFLEKEICRTSFASNWDDIKKNPKYCKYNKQKIKVSFKELYNIFSFQSEISIFDRLVEETNPMIVAGAGVHENYNFIRIIKKYIKPLLDITKKNKNVTLIWVAYPPPTDMKPAVYFRTQSLLRTKEFNNDIERFCKENNIKFFDTFKIFKGMHSFDGTHYGTELNFVKFKIFIKYLRMFYEQN